jgi:ketosteroid isomerase-like protein
MPNPTAVEIVLEAFAAVEHRDEERFLALCHPDVAFHWPPSLVAGRIEHRWEEIWDPLQPTESERRMSPA